MAKNTPIVYLVYGMKWKQHWADTRSIIKTCMWLTAAVFLLWVVFFRILPIALISFDGFIP